MTAEEKIRTELFEIRQKFLREIPHPKLIVKAIRQLTVRGGLTELDQSDYTIDALNSDYEKEELLVYLNDYINVMLKIKHQIAQSQTYAELREKLADLSKGQWNLFLKLQTYLPEISEDLDKEIKISSPTDAYQLLKSIQELNLKENEIKHYLCTKITGFEGHFDEITTVFLRANKIVNHG